MVKRCSVIIDKSLRTDATRETRSAGMGAAFAFMSRVLSFHYLAMHLPISPGPMNGTEKFFDASHSEGRDLCGALRDSSRVQFHLMPAFDNHVKIVGNFFHTGLKTPSFGIGACFDGRTGKGGITCAHIAPRV